MSASRLGGRAEPLERLGSARLVEAELGSARLANPAARLGLGSVNFHAARLGSEPLGAELMSKQLGAGSEPARAAQAA